MRGASVTLFRRSFGRCTAATPSSKAFAIHCRSMASSMKAVIFNEHGDTEVLKYTDIDRPTAGEGQVVIKNEYAGVSELLHLLAGNAWVPCTVQ